MNPMESLAGERQPHHVYEFAVPTGRIQQRTVHLATEGRNEGADGAVVPKHLRAQGDNALIEAIGEDALEGRNRGLVAPELRLEVEVGGRGGVLGRGPLDDDQAAEIPSSSDAVGDPPGETGSFLVQPTPLFDALR